MGNLRRQRIRLYGSIITIVCVACVFLTSIPALATFFGMHQFGLFLGLSLLSILFLDVFVIDMLQIYTIQGWRMILFVILTLCSIGFLISLFASYYQSTTHFLVYISYGLGVLLFLHYKYSYHEEQLSPTIRGLVSHGSSILAILLSVCYASFVVSLGNIDLVSCERLQYYSQSRMHIVGGISASSSNTTEKSGIEKLLSSWKQRYVDEIVQERRDISKQVCDTMYHQIEIKLQQFEQPIRASLMLLLFFLIRPFVIFFLWIETLVAYVLLSCLVFLGLYQRESVTKNGNQRM